MEIYALVMVFAFGVWVGYGWHLAKRVIEQAREDVRKKD